MLKTYLNFELVSKMFFEIKQHNGYIKATMERLKYFKQKQ